MTTRGIVESREALASPGDCHRAVVLRRTLAVDAPAATRATLQMAAGFGAHPSATSTATTAGPGRRT